MMAIFACSCSKSEPINDNSGKTLRVTYTFAPGVSNADGGYFDFSKGETINFSNINSNKNIVDNVRLGDQIKLFMNRQSKNTVGNFAIRFSIGDKLIKEVDGSNDLNIQLLYTISDKDFN